MHVAGEVTTTAYADIPTIVRERILEIGYDSSEEGLRRRVLRRRGLDRRQSPDIAQGVDTAYEARGRGRRGRRWTSRAPATRA